MNTNAVVVGEVAVVAELVDLVETGVAAPAEGMDAG